MRRSQDGNLKELIDAALWGLIPKCVQVIIRSGTTHYNAVVCDTLTVNTSAHTVGHQGAPPPTTSLQCAALAYSLFDCHPPIVSESLEAMGFVHPLSLTDKFA